MNIVLFGAPGSGKGTQSALLVEQKQFKHLSTGDLFRAAIKAQTPLGNLAKSYIDKGNLVPDDVTIGLIREELKKVSNKNFILDGFPRNIFQAQALEVLLNELKLKLDKAVFLEIKKDLLLDRLTGRRVCKKCGAVYHIDSKPSQKEHICDLCGGEVIQREDDKPAVIRDRLDVYEKNTAPLKDYFKKLNLYIEIDGAGSQNQVFERITIALKN